MTYEEVKRRAFLLPPEEEQHPGPPPGWVPPPPPEEMEPECEAVITGALRADGETITYRGGTWTATEDNQSAVYARGGAQVALTGTVLEKQSGALVQEYTDSQGNPVRLPMLRGINSTVLANGNGTEVRLIDTQIVSRCEPGDMALEAANGVFSVFRGKAFLNRVNIELDGGFGHGLYDSQFGVICADDCRIVTTGHCASALATDQPGGDLYIRDTAALCKGPASAGVYVDGGSHAELCGCDLRSLQAEGAVLCNDGYLRIEDTVIRGVLGAKIWQPVEKPGRMELCGCILIADGDSAFVFDGGFGTAVLERCVLSPAAGHCAIESRRCPQHYDHIGNGTAILRGCRISGDVAAADDCSLAVKLENSGIRGRMHHVDLTVGYGSQVVFTGDSELRSLQVETLQSLWAAVPCTVTYVPGAKGLSGDYDLGNLKLVAVKGETSV
ncbi:MAG: hypothetical protein IJ206_08270 [Oscillospiraceae bacterium]|nr:hypothetical protein [Oscillospiraceae bacterium]